VENILQLKFKIMSTYMRNGDEKKGKAKRYID